MKIEKYQVHGEIGATIYVNIAGNQYEGIVDENGKWSIDIPVQQVGTVITVTQKEKDKIYIIVLSVLGNKKVSEKEAEEVCRSIIKKEKEAEINPQLVEKDVHKISVGIEKNVLVRGRHVAIDHDE